MKISDILQSLGIIVALLASLGTLYKVYKMTPVERKQGDADAADKYADAAAKAAEQVSKALERIDTLEKRGDAMSEKVDALQKTLTQRDKCIETLNKEIKRRDDMIAEWAKGIKILVEQLQKAGQTPAWEPHSIEFPKLG